MCCRNKNPRLIPHVCTHKLAQVVRRSGTAGVPSADIDFFRPRDAGIRRVICLRSVMKSLRGTGEWRQGLEIIITFRARRRAPLYRHRRLKFVFIWYAFPPTTTQLWKFFVRNWRVNMRSGCTSMVIKKKEIILMYYLDR